MPPIPLSKRATVIELHKQGNSQRMISSSLRISRKAVQNILKKHQKGLPIKNMSKTCTPPKLTQREKRKIVMTSKKDHFLTANQVRHVCNLGSKVSVSTVKRVLNEANLFGRVATRKPSLTKKQIAARLKWCRERSMWNETDWSKIIFSDESKIELLPKRRTYVRRNRNENLKASNLSKTKKFCPYIMIWGGIRADGKRFIKNVNGTVDSLAYQTILDDALPVLYNGRYLLQQDGAPCHTSRSTSQYLTLKQIRMLKNWPSQSADLSPIENLWDFLKGKVSERKPMNVEELWNITQEEFNLIPDDYIKKLYASMPRRVSAVIQAKGANTKY